MRNNKNRVSTEGVFQQHDQCFPDAIAEPMQGILVEWDWKPLFVNQAYANLLGYDSAEDILAMESIEDQFALFERPRLWADWQAWRRGSTTPVRHRVEAICKDGSTVELDSVAKPICWRGQLAVEHTVIDIAGRKSALEALKASEARYRTLLDGITEGIAPQDERDVVVDVNDKFCHMPGESRDAIVGRPSSAFIVGSNVIGVALASPISELNAQQELQRALKESEKRLCVLSGQLMNAQERERERISSELHDGISQTLCAIKFELESCFKRWSRSSDNATDRCQDAIIQRIQETIEEVHGIAMNLRPAVLDRSGVLSTLEWFCRHYQRPDQAIEMVKEIVIEENEIPTDLKVVVYRVVQEAFHNIAKHAGASRVFLELKKTEAAIRLRIHDNGQGFDVPEILSSTSYSAGLGLQSMRERVQATGGLFSIESNPTAGTTLQACWSEQVLGSLAD